MITPEQRIDAALDSVLRASGSALKHYAPGKKLDDMRDVMNLAAMVYVREIADKDAP